MMTRILNYIIVQLFVFNTGTTISELEINIREMMMEVKEMKEQIISVNDLKKSYNDLKGEHEQMKNKNIQLEEDLRVITKELDTTKNELTVLKEEFMTKSEKLERDVCSMMDAPYFHICGYKHFKSINSQSMTYDTIFYNSTNTESGGLDLDTGIFTSPYPGSYTVTWSLMAEDNSGDDWVWIYLRKNSRNIAESFHKSFYTGYSGWVDNMGQ